MSPQRREDTMRETKRRRVYLSVLSLCLGVFVVSVLNRPSIAQKQTEPPAPLEGCLKCHADIEPMHRYGGPAPLDKLDNGKDAKGLTCTFCHGGNPAATMKEEAHVRPRYPSEWLKNGKFRVPERSGPLLARESLEFVRFLNPGDLRVAQTTCGSSECHSAETKGAMNSMMTHGAMLWGAALYNNGGFPIKDTNFGESYSRNGAAQSLIQIPQPTAEQRRLKGILPF